MFRTEMLSTFAFLPKKGGFDESNPYTNLQVGLINQAPTFLKKLKKGTVPFFFRRDALRKDNLVACNDNQFHAKT